MLPLEGYTVVALEQAVAAPLATRHLADLGARVIKIERPGSGDFARGYDTTVRGLASHFVWLNRSKESLTLDVKRPEAKAVLELLLARADVFIHNLAPGAVDRLGLAAARLRSAFPRLVICQISGYGTTGPYRDRKAYDLLVQSEAGILAITGTPETPSKAGISIADIAGGMYAYSGILAALLARQTTGQGAALEVSLFDALAEWMGYPLYYTAYGGGTLERTGARHAAIAPYGPFAAGDGEIIYFGIQNDREWASFCETVLASPDVRDDPRFVTNTMRVTNREALHALIHTRFSQWSAAHLRERLDLAQIAHARMNTVEQFIDHPQLSERNRWRKVGSPAGPLRALLPPVTMEGVEPVMGPIPEVGTHTRSILQELGIDEDTLEAWRRSGVI